MIRRETTALSSRASLSGPLTYPGLWHLTWARMAGTGIWVLIDMRPAVGEGA